MSIYPLHKSFLLQINYSSWHHYKKLNWSRMAKPHLNFFWWLRVLFQLRPLSFAYKDHQQIIKLFIETLNHLYIVATASYGFKVSPTDLLQKIDAIMTDAATKNLLIENSIASELNSQYKPIHLLCKRKPWIDQIWMFSARQRNKWINLELLKILTQI